MGSHARDAEKDRLRALENRGLEGGGTSGRRLRRWAEDPRRIALEESDFWFFVRAAALIVVVGLGAFLLLAFLLSR